MAISPIPHWFEGSEYTHKVAACIMKYGPISRITLAQILGLSQGAVSRITSDLIYAGVIEETPMAAGHGGKLPKDFLRKSAQKSIQKENTERRGRPQTGLRIIANARTFVGMKINTTHITAVTVNALGQIVTGCHDLPLDDDSPESVVDVIRQLTMDCADEAIMAGLPSPCAVGVSLGGHITDDSVTTFAPFLHWSKPVEFSAMIRKATGLPTGIYNDIDSLVVDACMFGSGVGLNSFAVVTIGIGVGYSLTVNGEAEQVVVEDVKGYKQQDAYDALKALNLSPKIQAVADDDTAVGYVVKTDPAAGSTVSTGTTVTIYVSSGPSTESAVIPNIVGYQYSAAKEELEAAGFVVTAEYDDESDKDENTVLSVSPNEGEKAKKGSVVTVTVSSGKGAQKDVYYDIPLPGGVSDDLTMKIYVDGTLIETRTVNPSTSPYSNMTFTGKDRANLVITLNDQQYITAEIDYTTQSINVTSQQSYATPEPEPTPTPDNGGDMSESDGSVTAHED